MVSYTSGCQCGKTRYEIQAEALTLDTCTVSKAKNNPLELSKEFEEIYKRYQRSR